MCKHPKMLVGAVDMNERIKVLALEAWMISQDQARFEEKFAELIVNQCVAMAKGFEYAIERDGLSAAMREHFGVEE